MLVFLQNQLLKSLVAGVLFLFVTNFSLFAQEPGRQPFEEMFNVWRKNNYQEKMYVHTDKAVYITGEICWFKIYNVDAYNHEPAGLSKVGLY